MNWAAWTGPLISIVGGVLLLWLSLRERRARKDGDLKRLIKKTRLGGFTAADDKEQ